MPSNRGNEFWAFSGAEICIKKNAKKKGIKVPWTGFQITTNSMAIWDILPLFPINACSEASPLPQTSNTSLPEANTQKRQSDPPSKYLLEMFGVFPHQIFHINSLFIVFLCFI